MSVKPSDFRDKAGQALAKLQERIKTEEVKFVDLRFTDTDGRLNHICRRATTIDEDCFARGVPFDSSSIAGWGAIEKSDMVLIPDVDTAYVDPFTAQPTMNMICNVFDIKEEDFYHKDPRAAAIRAYDFLKRSGIGTDAYFGFEVEFFVFDSARFSLGSESTFFDVESIEGKASSGRKYDYGNSGYRPHNKGGYSLVPPFDSMHDLRSEILETLATIGISPLVHHHEVAPSQCEIGFDYGTMITTADKMQKVKYVIRNVVTSYGKTATFMPKPIADDNGSGMHCHQSVWNGDKNLFHDPKGDYGLSDIGRFYIGGILKHGRALAAFTNPTVNSYKRLLPGYEAPTVLAYSPLNRSAAIRIPHFTSSSGKDSRIEVRFPDPSANPYLCSVALLMAGLDGIINKLDPGKPQLGDLYALTKEELSVMPQMPASLQESLDSLDSDREFLKAGGVLSDRCIDDYLTLKSKELKDYARHVSPWEYHMYYGR